MTATQAVFVALLASMFVDLDRQEFPWWLRYPILLLIMVGAVLLWVFLGLGERI